MVCGFVARPCHPLTSPHRTTCGSTSTLMTVSRGKASDYPTSQVRKTFMVSSQLSRDLNQQPV